MVSGKVFTSNKLSLGRCSLKEKMKTVEMLSRFLLKTIQTLESEEGNGSRQGYQLEELQEQLMMTVLEKQQLADELKAVKEEQMKRIMQQLRLERDRNRQLTEELQSKTKSRRKFGRRRTNENLYKSKSMTALNSVEANGSAELETMEEGDEEEEGKERPTEETDSEDRQSETRSLQEEVQPEKKKDHVSWLQILQERIDGFIQNLKEDFSEVSEQPEVFNDPFGDPLHIPKLKRNLIRSANVIDPLADAVKDSTYIFRWEKPVVTFIIFLIYMYSVYQGLLICFAFALLTFLFIYAYFRQKEWNSHSELSGKIDAKEVEMSVGLRDQIAIMIQVSRRAQNISGDLCDISEKAKNLILWKQPEITKQALVLLCIGLVASIYFSASTLCSLTGYYLGIRMFVIEYVFYRFPRVQQKYDKFNHIFKDLKSDVEWQKRMRDQIAFMKGKRSSSMGGSTLSLAPSTPVSRSGSRVSLLTEPSTPSTSSSSSSSSSTFAEVFQLPPTEVPFALWLGGRRCTLVNKDKPLTGTFRVGKMYLTKNYLCFERFKTPSPKNLTIPLSSVVRLEKAKLYHWLPGGGRALEIKLKGLGKKLIFVFQTQLFGTIVNRDEAYDSIMEIGKQNDYAWAN